MDLIKIGTFIASLRRKHNLTQIELAEKLNITDRAISKWECGKSLPDASIMLELCSILEISVNELLKGEKIEMEEYNKQTEENLIKLVKEKEEADKKLLKAEVVIGISGFVLLCLFITFGVYFAEIGVIWVSISLIILGFIFALALFLIALRIEQIAGYYECSECGFHFVPTYKQALFAPHLARTRKMRCPNCGKKNYCKKVISKSK